MKIVYVLGVAVGAIALMIAATSVYYARVVNPRVERELFGDPNGARAQKAMLVTLPSGRRIPVNYLREGDRVFAGADGNWWKELVGAALPVQLWIRGVTLRGRARAITDDSAYTKSVFARLRPNAIPGFGTLVEIQLDDVGPESAR